MDTKLKITADGSHTFFVPELDEHYHSVNGAIQESMHVFIDAGLKQCEKTEVNVLEIGFGTGLNAFLSLLEAEKMNWKIDFTSLELYPISASEAKKLNYAELIDPFQKENFRKLHSAEWDKWEQITIYFSLQKLCLDFSDPQNFQPESKFDIIFFDAFAPDKQPEMWAQPIFDSLYSFCNADAILTTYCAKGSVRRMLTTAGFKVERLLGPKGKREMLRGRRI